MMEDPRALAAAENEAYAQRDQEQMEAMMQEKTSLLLLYKLAGREPVVLTQADIDAIQADFAGTMPVFYAYQLRNGDMAYQVISAEQAEEVQKAVAAGNAERMVEALRPGAFPVGAQRVIAANRQAIVGPTAAMDAIGRAGGIWPSGAPEEPSGS